MDIDTWREWLFHDPVKYLRLTRDSNVLTLSWLLKFQQPYLSYVPDCNVSINFLPTETWDLDSAYIDKEMLWMSSRDSAWHVAQNLDRKSNGKFLEQSN